MLVNKVFKYILLSIIFSSIFACNIANIKSNGNTVVNFAVDSRATADYYYTITASMTGESDQVVSGTLTELVFTELYAGDWTFDMDVFSNSSDGNLIYVGTTTTTIVEGTVNTVSITLSPNGSGDISLDLLWSDNYGEDFTPDMEVTCTNVNTLEEVLYTNFIITQANDFTLDAGVYTIEIALMYNGVNIGGAVVANQRILNGETITLSPTLFYTVEDSNQTAYRLYIDTSSSDLPSAETTLTMELSSSTYNLRETSGYLSSTIIDEAIDYSAYTLFNSDIMTDEFVITTGNSAQYPGEYVLTFENDNSGTFEFTRESDSATFSGTFLFHDTIQSSEEYYYFIENPVSIINFNQFGMLESYVSIIDTPYIHMYMMDSGEEQAGEYGIENSAGVDEYSITVLTLSDGYTMTFSSEAGSSVQLTYIFTSEDRGFVEYTIEQEDEPVIEKALGLFNYDVSMGFVRTWIEDGQGLHNYHWNSNSEVFTPTDVLRVSSNNSHYLYDIDFSDGYISLTDEYGESYIGNIPYEILGEDSYGNSILSVYGDWDMLSEMVGNVYDTDNRVYWIIDETNGELSIYDSTDLNILESINDYATVYTFKDDIISWYDTEYTGLYLSFYSVADDQGYVFNPTYTDYSTASYLNYNDIDDPATISGLWGRVVGREEISTDISILSCYNSFESQYYDFYMDKNTLRSVFEVYDASDLLVTSGVYNLVTDANTQIDYWNDTDQTVISNVSSDSIQFTGTDAILYEIVLTADGRIDIVNNSSSYTNYEYEIYLDNDQYLILNLSTLDVETVFGMDNTSWMVYEKIDATNGKIIFGDDIITYLKSGSFSVGMTSAEAISATVSSITNVEYKP